MREYRCRIIRLINLAINTRIAIIAGNKKAVGLIFLHSFHITIPNSAV